MNLNVSTLASAPRFKLPPTAPAPARAALRLLAGLHHGRLDLQLPEGAQARFGAADAQGPHAAMRLVNWNVFAAAFRSGDIGFAESYIDGDWSTPDLAALLRFSSPTATRSKVPSTAAGGARCCTACGTCSIATRVAAAARTSTPTMTSATRSTASGSTRQ
jgi:cyclopropane-fatty-acyl-phospholipid synthase